MKVYNCVMIIYIRLCLCKPTSIHHNGTSTTSHKMQPDNKTNHFITIKDYYQVITNVTQDYNLLGAAFTEANNSSQNQVIGFNQSEKYNSAKFEYTTKDGEETSYTILATSFLYVAVTAVQDNNVQTNNTNNSDFVEEIWDVVDAIQLAILFMGFVGNLGTVVLMRYLLCYQTNGSW